MTRFVTDPRQAREVKMHDGTSYPVGADGHVVITDAGHLAEMDHGNRDYFSSAPGFVGGDHRACPCGRAPWRWERECPRCGRTLHSA
jgi:hypothetical protein